MKNIKSGKPFISGWFSLIAVVILTICATIDTYAQTQVACELSKMNVVYVGLENPLIIAASDYSENDLEIAVSNGEIEKIASSYILRPDKPGIVKLTISTKGKTLATKTLRALQTPDPQVGIVLKLKDGTKFISKGEIPVAYLDKIEKVHAFIDDFLFDIEYNVEGFELYVVGDSGINVREEANSNMMTDQQKKILKSLRSGQIIHIEDIKVTGTDGSIRKLNNLAFSVT